MLRPAMAGVHAPQAGSAVENLPPFGRPVVHALGAGEKARRLLELAVRRKRHPEGGLLEQFGAFVHAGEITLAVGRDHAAAQKTQRRDHARAGGIACRLQRAGAATRRVHLAGSVPARLGECGPELPAGARQPLLQQLVLWAGLLRRLLAERPAALQSECRGRRARRAGLDGLVPLDVLVLFGLAQLVWRFELQQQHVARRLRQLGALVDKLNEARTCATADELADRKS